MECVCLGPGSRLLCASRDGKSGVMWLSGFGMLVDLGLACGGITWGQIVCVWYCRFGMSWDNVDGHRLAVLTGGYMAG
jgi:hypothetical protein